jgi:hypothetical protein
LVDESGHVWSVPWDHPERIDLLIRHRAAVYVSGLDTNDPIAVHRVPQEHAEEFWEHVQPLLNDPGDHSLMVLPLILFDRPHEKRRKGQPPQVGVILLEFTCS